MELRWLEKEVPDTFDDEGNVHTVRVTRVLQYRNMYGWHDVPVERLDNRPS